MKGTLKTIQTIAQIARILSMVVMVCCIVGVCGSLIGIVATAVGFEQFNMGSVTMRIMETDEAVSAAQIYAYLIEAMIVAAAQGVTAFFAGRYFKNEMEAGTPFTQDGATELFRLGIISILVPLGGQILAEIVQSAVGVIFAVTAKNNFSADSTVILGALFLVISLLCRYGAEVTEGKAEQ